MARLTDESGNDLGQIVEVDSVDSADPDTRAWAVYVLNPSPPASDAAEEDVLVFPWITPAGIASLSDADLDDLDAELIAYKIGVSEERARRQHKPKKGDRFIHLRYLAEGATPPYDTDDKYQVRVVTFVETGADYTLVYHAAENSSRSDRKFLMSREKESVRRWL
jgi:hypothetical protein